MTAKKRTPIVMVQVAPGHSIGLPTFDIDEYFDDLGIPPDERSGILERAGGFDGVQVSQELERETFQWLYDHGRGGASARTPFVTDETMVKLHRRIGNKPIGEKVVQSILQRLDSKAKAESIPPSPKPPAGKGENPTPSRRGRKSPAPKTLEGEERLYEEWQRSRGAEIPKKDFARDKRMTMGDLDKLLERVAKRRKRAGKPTDVKSFS